MNKHVTVAIASLAAPAAVLAGCANQSAEDDSATTTTTTSDAAQGLTAQLTTADGTAVADATIDFTGGFATVTIETVDDSTLSPGFHGLHLHQFGRCEGADFSSAGEHFQAPGHTGMPASGDLPPLLVRSDNAGKLVATTDAFTEGDLTGPNGSSIMLHQGADMPGATEGADVRLACGVISPATAPAAETTTTVVTETVPPGAPVPPAAPVPSPGAETTTPATPAPEGSPTPTTTTTVTETTTPPETTTTTVPATPAPPAG
ncbi:superoxide dismutase family protein [Mycobacterium sp. SMC-4]|uniref:superoxide dismutase family protein n=1 Tax=Mycobacterium sp. SMC-4 TaxID=2857059 RepID=UPI003CFD5DF5